MEDRSAPAHPLEISSVAAMAGLYVMRLGGGGGLQARDLAADPGGPTFVSGAVSHSGAEGSNGR